MAYMIKKTVVIGLGGTGRDAVLHVKRKLLDTYKEIPPAMKFLVIDTTDKEGLTAGDREISLEPGEFLKLEVKNPIGLFKTNREVKAWFPDNIPLYALTSGAKAIRALGRLAAFANANDLYRSINNLMSSIRDFRVGRYSDKYEILSENIIVNIVASLSGGTGSGCFFDTAVLVRESLTATDRLIAYFLLPDVFVGRPATQNVEPNAYGALKEIEYFFAPENRSVASYYFGGSEKRIESALFDALYLINNVNRRGTEYSEIKDLTELLGVGIFLQSSATGKGAADIIDNLEAQIVGKKWWGKPTVCSSFGVSEIIYRGDWFADLYAEQIALSVIQEVFVGGDQANVEEAADGFIDKVGIREDTADEAINAILEPGSYRKFPLPTSKLNKDMVQTVFRKRDTHIEETSRNLREKAKSNLAKLNEDKIKALDDYINEKLNRPKGLEFCRSFLATLLGRLGEFKNMMETERDEFNVKKEELKGRYDAANSEADKASKKIFGARNAIETVLKSFKALVETESGYILEIERRERAIEFFANIIDEVDGRLDKLNSLSQYFNALIKEISHDVQRRKLEKRDIKPFVHEVRPKILSEWVPKVEPQDFLTWLKENKEISVLDLTDMRIEGVKNTLMEYGLSQKEVREIKEKKIEDILKELTPDEQLRHVRLLDEMAAPLWQYDTGRVAGDKKTENIYLFGVEDAFSTLFTPEEIRKAIPMQFEPSTISTGDPKRVICFKVEAAVPVFVVNNLVKYREKYSDPDKPFSFHINKTWEKELPDLFPPTEEEASRKYWSIALADPYNLITKKGEFYYLRSEQKGERTKDYLVKLAQGRSMAMRAFLSDSAFIEETRENIEKLTQKFGNDTIIERLRNYGMDLENKAKRQTEDVRSQIEEELKDIENYINSLSLM